VLDISPAPYPGWILWDPSAHRNIPSSCLALRKNHDQLIKHKDNTRHFASDLRSGRHSRDGTWTRATACACWTAARLPCASCPPHPRGPCSRARAVPSPMPALTSAKCRPTAILLLPSSRRDHVASADIVPGHRPGQENPGGLHGGLHRAIRADSVNQRNIYFSHTDWNAIVKVVLDGIMVTLVRDERLVQVVMWLDSEQRLWRRPRR
jgi:hypothetical protein